MTLPATSAHPTYNCAVRSPRGARVFAVAALLGLGAGVAACTDGVDASNALDADDLRRHRDAGTTSDAESNPDAALDATTDAAPPMDAGSQTTVDAASPSIATDCSTVPCYYVRAGASGRGVDWNDALPDLPAQLQRGATYFVATGRYGAHTFRDPLNGSSYITVKKATATDHGTALGWAAAYGDGEAVFQAGTASAWAFETGYYTVDGVVGAGNSRGGYGFRLYSAASRCSSSELLDWSGTMGTDHVSHLSVRHVELDWNNGTSACDSAVTRAVGGWLDSDHVSFSSCYFHDSSGYVFYVGQWSGADYRPITDTLTIEQSTFENNGGGGGPNAHWETFWFTDNRHLVFRNNIVDNTLASDGQTGWLMLGASQDTKIYGNVFRCSTSACGIGGNGVIATWSADAYVNDGVFITNNTFADLSGGYGPHMSFTHNTTTDTNVVLKNNLYYNHDFYWSGVTLQSNGAFGGGQTGDGSAQQLNLGSTTFVDYVGHDFRLRVATDPGDSTVGAEYAVDPTGKVRGADGVWDRGAYEYTSAP